MNWFLFAILSWILLGLEIGLGKNLAAGSGDITPSFVIPLVVFIALNAPARTALWTALVMGLLTDLASLNAVFIYNDGTTARLVGLHAISYLVAAQFALSLRGMVLARNIITPIILSAIAALLAGLVMALILGIRSAYQPVSFDASTVLVNTLLSALFTGAVAIPVTLLLVALSPFFGFANQTTHQHVTHARAFKR